MKERIDPCRPHIGVLPQVKRGGKPGGRIQTAPPAERAVRDRRVDAQIPAALCDEVTVVEFLLYRRDLKSGQCDPARTGDRELRRWRLLGTRRGSTRQRRGR